MTKAILIAAILTAGCVPNSSPKTCFYGRSSFTGECNSPPEEAAKTSPPLVRSHTMRTDKAIDGILVAADPVGAAGWRLGIKNTTGDSVSVVWDESSFVASNGVSAGRLILGETRKLDVAKAQPPSPLAPQSAIIQVVLIEKMLDDEELEAKIADARGLDPDKIAKVRQNRYELIVGGKMFVTVVTATGKQTWTGVVEPAAKPEGK